jgi:lipid II:glycine glycyltransferase (peptidoglycan interpeptide bridge formation enzyme)
MTFPVKVFESEKEHDPDWDSFLANVPSGHHVQTSLWGQAKSILGYRAKRIIICENEQIVAGGQLLIKRLAPFLSVGFMPKGPLYLDKRPQLAAIMLEEIKRVAQTNHIQLLALQPPYEDSELVKIFHKKGLLPSWLELASSATILIDLSLGPDEILAHMKRQSRQNIRRSEREGMVCREGDEKDLTTFYRFHVETSKRQGFTPYPERYYWTMWQIFSPGGHVKLMISEFNKEAVSALLLIAFNDTVVAKILGWSGHHPECRPNDAVFWASILWAKSHGYRYFDLEGIDRGCATKVLQGLPLNDEMKDSYTFFKLGYGGQITLFPQAYDFLYNPFMRWPYRKIFSKPESWSNAYAYLERIRRRFA